MGEARRRWTTAEDALLWELYQIQEIAPTGKCSKINWNEIARQIPARSNKDCRKRYYNRFTGGLRKGSWTQEEDERLFQLVERYHYRWAMIAQKMETRNADQCSKRWHHCLNPELERSPWTDEENHLLLSAVRTHGSSWKDIQRSHFPTRSANNIKNQHTILTRKGIIPFSIQPCCSSSSLIEASSKRPPSSPPSVASSHAILTPNNDAYSYCSLSSTPQLSSNEYFPATPDKSASLNSFGFQTPMPLQNEPCAYPYDYQPALYLDGSTNPEYMVCQPTGLEYELDVSAFHNGMVDQNVQRYPSFQTPFGF